MTKKNYNPARLGFYSCIFYDTSLNLNAGLLHSSSWVPQGNYLESNRDECTVSLIYAVHLKKQGSVSFEYQYPDNNLLFEFFVSGAHLPAFLIFFVCFILCADKGNQVR